MKCKLVQSNNKTRQDKTKQLIISCDMIWYFKFWTPVFQVQILQVHLTCEIFSKCTNRPFLSCRRPLFQSEALVKVFLFPFGQILVHFHVNKTNFHITHFETEVKGFLITIRYWLDTIARYFSNTYTYSHTWPPPALLIVLSCINKEFI